MSRTSAVVKIHFDSSLQCGLSCASLTVSLEDTFMSISIRCVREKLPNQINDQAFYFIVLRYESMSQHPKAQFVPNINSSVISTLYKELELWPGSVHVVLCDIRKSRARVLDYVQWAPDDSQRGPDDAQRSPDDAQRVPDDVSVYESVSEPLCTYFLSSEGVQFTPEGMHSSDSEHNICTLINSIVDNVAIKYGKLSKYQRFKEIWRCIFIKLSLISF